MEDPRRVLEQAAERRVACEILPRQGGCASGQILRVERGGVVVHAPDLCAAGGEDVRCWFAFDGTSYTFEASVIRAGVPVPDRSQHGFLLGFLDGWTTGEAPPLHTARESEGLDLLVIPPNGPGVSLLAGPARLLEVSVNGVTFTLPKDHKLVFVEGGSTRLRFVVPGEDPEEVDARVSTLVSGEGCLIYTVSVSGVRDPEPHRRMVAALQRALEAG
ncbi:MAG: hypothetical protein JXB39_08010 [Deltaproteobacteria bacterium]|nr:hypothetical protein [Deltaproteobacteria bacterium]